MKRRGILFVMTGASGVGKDTIWQAALPDIPNLHYAVSATTREQRRGEVHGKHYYFYARDVFEALVEQGGFLEHAEYAGDLYGTPKAQLERMLDEGKDALLKPELVGAREIKRQMPEAVMIFIAPPSLVELERRLRGRGTDSEEKIQKRLARAREEIKAVKEFDYVVINDELGTAVRDFCSIIYAERARTKHLSDEDIAQFLREGDEASAASSQEHCP
jgi:guanylate kinase